MYYSAGHDAYLVWHANGRRLWFKPALVEAHVLDAWAEYRLKRKREDEQEAKLTEQALYKRWRPCPKSRCSSAGASWDSRRKPVQ